jgi:N-methylhydantoinase B
VNLLLNPDVPGTALAMFYLGGDASQVCNAGGPQALDEVRLREGSLLWPKFPAPLGMRGLTLMRFLAAVNGLINVAGGKAPAAHSAYVISFMRGTYRDDQGDLKRFLMSDGIGVGWGARSSADGTDAVYFVAQENYPVEFLEIGYPVRLRTYGILRDSCGAGQYRGGCGIVREYDVLAEEAVLALRIDSIKNPPWGIAGGMAGGAGRAVVNPGTNHERVLGPLSDGNVLRKGDVLRIETGGGGGHGHPFDRPTEKVLEDVLGDFVSADAARRLYGVAIAKGVVDPAGTAKLRARRPATGAFHRHAYVDSLA